MTILDSNYGRIIDFIPQIVLILDEQYRIIEFNQTTLKTTGFSKEQFNQLDMHRLVPSGAMVKFKKSLTRPNQLPFETQFIKADHSLLDVRIRVESMRTASEVVTIIFAEDLTDQKQKELDLLRFSNVIERTINPIQITDAKGVMVYVNPAFESVTGYSREELIGKNPNILSSGKHDRTFWRGVWEFLLAGNVWHGQLENRRKDSTSFFTDLIISPIVDDAGSVVGFLGAHRDITQERVLEDQLARSQRMESIGTLAAGIAHEVGNPLTSISSLVQVMERTTTDNFAKEKLELIKSQVNRIARIIRQLVDFSRPTTHVIQAVDLNHVIQEAVNVVQYGKKVQNNIFELHHEKALPLLHTVPDQLQQVFINILMNAVDALGGKPGRISIRSTIRSNTIHVRISDTGDGIPAKELQNIFEPFYTTKGIGKGTGLGLWVSYGIMKSLGGDIHVESTEGHGTTFTLTLPVKGT